MSAYNTNKIISKVRRSSLVLSGKSAYDLSKIKIVKYYENQPRTTLKNNGNNTKQRTGC